VAHTLSKNGSDQAQLARLLDTIKANLGRNPQEASRPMQATAQIFGL
jgi:hypothetical protein